MGTKGLKPANRKQGSKKTDNPAGGGMESLLASLPASSPRFVEPMKCRLLAQLPTGTDWIYEIKFDGYRGLAIKDGEEVRLLSRNNKDLGSRFPGIVRALQKLPCERIVLDGEVVALDANGRSSFQSLQRANEPAFRNVTLF